MASAVAGAVLGPRPGMAICSFSKGRIEILFRIIAPLVCSAFRYYCTSIVHALLLAIDMWT